MCMLGGIGTSSAGTYGATRAVGSPRVEGRSKPSDLSAKNQARVPSKSSKHS